MAPAAQNFGFHVRTLPMHETVHATSPSPTEFREERDPLRDAHLVDARQLKNSTGRKWAIGIWCAQLLATVGAMIAAIIDIESIVFTGPIASLLGLALAFFASRLLLRSVLWFGLSSPIMWAVCALLIVTFDLGPGRAQWPISALICICVTLSAPLAAAALRAIIQTPPRQSPMVWQYSLKSLLIAMTALCVLLAVVRGLIAIAGRGEDVLFAIFFILIVAAAGLSVWYFFRSRRRASGREMWVIELTPEAASIVKCAIASGHFADVSEVVTASVRLLNGDSKPEQGNGESDSDRDRWPGK
jgi:hypothetical protein